MIRFPVASVGRALRLAGLITLCAAWAAPAQAQTTLNNITTNSANGGSFAGGQFWDTISGGAFDVFAIRGTDVQNGAIINGGGTRNLSEAFTTDGNHSYTLLMQPGNYNPQGGLNLFFNGSTSAQITAFAPFNTLATPPTATATGSAIYNPFGGSGNGSGSLSFTNGGVTVQLTSLRFFNANVNRVNSGSVSATPNLTAGEDLGVQFTLNVSGNEPVNAVPEPGAAMLLLPGLMAVVTLRRKKVAG